MLNHKEERERERERERVFPCHNKHFMKGKVNGSTFI